MSDTGQGEGWWVASDGKWYPPESHPASVATSEPTLDAPPSRWLGRSDQPPPQPTDTAGAGPVASSPTPTATRWSNPRAAPAHLIPPVPATAPSALSLSPVPPRPPRRPVALGVHQRGRRGPDRPDRRSRVLHVARHAGAGAQNRLQITYPTSGHPTFSGTIAGTSLTGSVTNSSIAAQCSATGPVASTVHSLLLKGRYRGDSYLLHLTLTMPDTGTGQGGQWQVTGTEGANQVTGIATFDEPTESDPSMQIPFSGRIGSSPILGNAVIARRSAGSIDVTVSFVTLP